ncbi:ABC transporter substrate-binding protein, partial [Acinetobacter baumannii]
SMNLSLSSRLPLRMFPAALLALAAVSTPVCSVAAPLPPVRIGMIEGLSGPFANAGEAVVRNISYAIERVNARGGVNLP